MEREALQAVLNEIERTRQLIDAYRQLELDRLKTLPQGMGRSLAISMALDLIRHENCKKALLRLDTYQAELESYLPPKVSRLEGWRQKIAQGWLKPSANPSAYLWPIHWLKKKLYGPVNQPYPHEVTGYLADLRAREDRVEYIGQKVAEILRQGGHCLSHQLNLACISAYVLPVKPHEDNCDALEALYDKWEKGIYCGLKTLEPKRHKEWLKVDQKDDLKMEEDPYFLPKKSWLTPACRSALVYLNCGMLRWGMEGKSHPKWGISEHEKSVGALNDLLNGVQADKQNCWLVPDKTTTLSKQLVKRNAICELLPRKEFFDRHLYQLKQHVKGCQENNTPLTSKDVGVVLNYNELPTLKRNLFKRG